MEKNKLLFWDLETAGNWPDYNTMKETDPRFAELWMKRDAFLRERYEGNRDLNENELFMLKSGLQPEFGRVVCASFGYFSASGEKKVTSYYSDEHSILTAAKGVINNAQKAGWQLCGHNIKRFDIPFLWKRMLSHKIAPPPLISAWGKKPWEMTSVDTAELWSGGVWQESFASLDTLSALFDIPSPKEVMQASRVHATYWEEKDYTKIAKYCEGDIHATMDIMSQILEITPLA
jgi:DNA polymerase elongation subunit (family B)